MLKYVLITSDVPDSLLKHLAKSKSEFRVYQFNPVLNLSDVGFHDRGNVGWMVCDKFIEGLEWEDYRIKPKNHQEAQEGDLSRGEMCNRGWAKYRCRAYQGKERFLKYEAGQPVTDNNPKGVVDGPSWIICTHCEHYAPRTLEGRKDVLAAIRKQYQRVLDEISGKISLLEAEIKKQSSGKAAASS